MATVTNNTDLSSVKWVLRELTPILNEVQRAIVSYVEAPEYSDAMVGVVDLLRQIHGTVQILELYGAAMLAEEMEQTVVELREGKLGNTEEAMEVLMRAALQLPDYLERIKAGSPDVPLVLLPMLNDMRAARGEALLSEAVLFVPDLSPIEPGEITRDEEEELTEVVRGLRLPFMRSLLGWYSNESDPNGLMRLGKIFATIEGAAHSQSSRKIWPICRAVVESLRDGGLKNSPSIKSLFGQIERSLKCLLDSGESEFVRTLSKDLLKNLLYYIARSTSDHRVVAEVQREYKLDELLPQREKLEEARRTHHGPSIELLQVANQGVRDDVSVIKDLVEIYVHAEDRKLTTLDPLDGLLRRVIDTMSVLGVGEARSFLEPKRSEIQEILVRGEDPGDDRLFDIAAALLKVEDMLDRHISDQTALIKVEPQPGSETADILSLHDLPEREYRVLIQTLVKESLRTFARTREAFIDFANQTENAHNIKNVPGLLRELIGVFDIVSNRVILPLLVDLHAFVEQRYVGEGTVPNHFEQELVADTITSLEYYIESLPDEDDEKEREYILGVSRSALDQLTALSQVDTTLLDAAVDDIRDPTSVPEVVDLTDVDPPQFVGDDDPTLAIDMDEDSDLTIPIDALESDATVQIDSPYMLDMENDETIQLDGLVAQSLADDETVQIDMHEAEFVPIEELLEAAEPAEIAVATEASSPPALRIISDDVDEEILDIFIEEALEEMGVISEFLPKWRANPDDEEALGRMRRSYHTLKGSGRLLGAESIGEFAWANEELLNYVLRGDIPINNNLFGLVNESANALPQLIAQLRGDSAEIDVRGLIARIQELEARALNKNDDGGEARSPTIDDLAAVTTREGSAPETSSAEIDEPPAALDDSVQEEPAQDAEDDEELLTFELEELDEPLEEVILATEAEIHDEPAVDLDAVRPAQTPAEPAVDPVLLDIFAKEARLHLDTLSSVVGQARSLSGTIPPSDKLVRALHTLQGSARTAQVNAIAELAAPLEKAARHKRELGQAFSDADGTLITEVVDTIGNALDALESGRVIPDTSALTARLSAFSSSVMSAQPEAPDVEEGDAELRSIFIEEAEELVNLAERLVGQWRESPQSVELIADMKRPLHTLKGGARMAGYVQVADLTHALESSIISREAVGDAPPDTYFDLLQEAVDALAVNVEQARSGQEIGRFDWIVGDLNDDIDHSNKALMDRESGMESTPAAPVVEEPESKPADISVPDVGSKVEPLDRPQTATPKVLEPLPESVLAQVPLTPVDNVVPLRMTANAIEEALTDRAPPTLQQHRNTDDKVQDQVRVRAELLDNLVNNAGEVSIYHARFGQQIGDMRFNINELDQTVERLRDQLRQMDQETEAQILYGYDKAVDKDQQDRDFDPLELDRYSQIQELSRSLLESVSDIDNIKTTLADLTRDSETLMLQQSRVSTELQDGLLRTRMVRFDGVEARLSRIVRQTAQALKKKASLIVTGGENEIDRSIQERMVAPLEHILRNAVAHGVETPEVREAAGKPAVGKVAIRLSLDGGDILIRVVDDGGGIDVGSVRRKGVERGLIAEGDQLSDQDVLQLLFESGFSTAEEVTQIAGRGVGLDVVGREIKQLGGSFTLESEVGVGTMFVIRLPQTLAISQALLVSCAGETYAIPINGIRGVSRLDIKELSQYYLDPDKRYLYGGEDYRVVHLTTLLNVEDSQRAPVEQAPLIMVRSGDEMAAVQVDELLGRREIVVKNAGEQVSAVRGIAGATLLGDGKVVLVLDIGGVLQTMDRGSVARELSGLAETQSKASAAAPDEAPAAKLTIMVVDDSITIRKVTTRALERHKINVVTAKDGVDAVTQLKESKPDLMLLDIEMPRMDGFEVAGFVRNDPRLKDLPIIVITSRTGEKHRQRALDIGVNKYLGKPYQETELIQLISEVLGKELASQ